MASPACREFPVSLGWGLQAGKIINLCTDRGFRNRGYLEGFSPTRGLAAVLEGEGIISIIAKFAFVVLLHVQETSLQSWGT